MKDEDIDWLVYHQLSETAPAPEDSLAGRCGLPVRDVEASLARLERACLIERCGGSARMLTFGEALVRNQVENDPDLPFTIENGVIKAKKGGS